VSASIKSSLPHASQAEPAAQTALYLEAAASSALISDFDGRQ
jgi:hypothetical protein